MHKKSKILAPLRSAFRVSRSPLPLDYEASYERLARTFPCNRAVGSSDFEGVGRVELGVLQMEGLRPQHTLLDLGCGNGRLAVQVIPTLNGGHYIGIDISQTMLRNADQFIRANVPHPPCSVRWIKQTTSEFSLSPRSVDMICAFSVFTHLEHEDSYLYLLDACRIIKPKGRFIFSCLPIRLPTSQAYFRQQASLDLKSRWTDVRNVVTTLEMMETIAQMAGWRPLKWYPADQDCIRVPPTGKYAALGQEVCVLEPIER